MPPRINQFGSGNAAMVISDNSSEKENVDCSTEELNPIDAKDAAAVVSDDEVEEGKSASAELNMQDGNQLELRQEPGIAGSNAESDVVDEESSGDEYPSEEENEPEEKEEGDSGDEEITRSEAEKVTAPSPVVGLDRPPANKAEYSSEEDSSSDEDEDGEVKRAGKLPLRSAQASGAPAPAPLALAAQQSDQAEEDSSGDEYSSSEDESEAEEENQTGENDADESSGEESSSEEDEDGGNEPTRLIKPHSTQVQAPVPPVSASKSQAEDSSDEESEEEKSTNGDDDKGNSPPLMPTLRAAAAAAPPPVVQAPVKTPTAAQLLELLSGAYNAEADPNLQAKNTILDMLTHGATCQARGRCKYPACTQAKAMIRHVSKCTVGPNCTISYCAKSKFVLKHGRRIQAAVLKKKAAANPAAGGQTNKGASPARTTARVPPRRARSNVKWVPGKLASIPEGENEDGYDSDDDDDEGGQPSIKKSLRNVVNNIVGSDSDSESDEPEEESSDEDEPDEESSYDDDEEGAPAPTSSRKGSSVQRNAGDSDSDEEEEEDVDVKVHATKQQNAIAQSNQCQRTSWEIEYSDDETEKTEEEGKEEGIITTPQATTTDSRSGEKVVTTPNTTAQPNNSPIQNQKSWEIEYSDDETENSKEADTSMPPSTIAYSDDETENSEEADQSTVSQSRPLQGKRSWEIEYSDDETEKMEEEGKEDEDDLTTPHATITVSMSAPKIATAPNKPAQPNNSQIQKQKSWEIEYSDDETENSGEADTTIPQSTMSQSRGIKHSDDKAENSEVAGKANQVDRAAPRAKLKDSSCHKGCSDNEPKSHNSPGEDRDEIQTCVDLMIEVGGNQVKSGRKAEDANNTMPHDTSQSRPLQESSAFEIECSGDESENSGDAGKEDKVGISTTQTKKLGPSARVDVKDSHDKGNEDNDISKDLDDDKCSNDENSEDDTEDCSEESRTNQTGKKDRSDVIADSEGDAEAEIQAGSDEHFKNQINGEKIGSESEVQDADPACVKPTNNILQRRKSWEIKHSDEGRAEEASKDKDKELETTYATAVTQQNGTNVGQHVDNAESERKPQEQTHRNCEPVTVPLSHMTAQSVPVVDKRDRGGREKIALEPLLDSETKESGNEVTDCASESSGEEGYVTAASVFASDDDDSYDECDEIDEEQIIPKQKVVLGDITTSSTEQRTFVDPKENTLLVEKDLDQVTIESDHICSGEVLQTSIDKVNDARASCRASAETVDPTTGPGIPVGINTLARTGREKDPDEITAGPTRTRETPTPEEGAPCGEKASSNSIGGNDPNEKDNSEDSSMNALVSTPEATAAGEENSPKRDGRERTLIAERAEVKGESLRAMSTKDDNASLITSKENRTPIAGQRSRERSGKDGVEVVDSESVTFSVGPKDSATSESQLMPEPSSSISPSAEQPSACSKQCQDPASLTTDKPPDLHTVYSPVYFKSLEGSLTMKEKHVCFHSLSLENKESVQRSLPYDSIAKVLTSPDSHAKALLKMVSVKGKTVTFELKDRTLMGKIKREIYSRLRRDSATVGNEKCSALAGVVGDKKEPKPMINQRPDDSKAGHEPALHVYQPVVFQKVFGLVRLSKGYFAFSPSNEDGSNQSTDIRLVEIAKTQVNPKRQAKALLRLHLHTGASLTFELKNRNELCRLQYDVESLMRNQARQLLGEGQSLPKGSPTRGVRRAKSLDVAISGPRSVGNSMPRRGQRPKHTERTETFDGGSLSSTPDGASMNVSTPKRSSPRGSKKARNVVDQILGGAGTRPKGGMTRTKSQPMASRTRLKGGMKKTKSDSGKGLTSARTGENKNMSIPKRKSTGTLTNTKGLENDKSFDDKSSNQSKVQNNSKWQPLQTRTRSKWGMTRRNSYDVESLASIATMKNKNKSMPKRKSTGTLTEGLGGDKGFDDKSSNHLSKDAFSARVWQALVKKAHVGGKK